MSDEALLCPICNAMQPPRPGLTVGAKLDCARCGERFTVTHVPASWALPAPAQASPPRPTLARPIRANRLVAAGVVGLMLVMAGIGLTYALWTVQDRRAHDKALPRKVRRPWLEGRVPLPPDDVVAPAELAGIGYLPGSTGLLAVVQVQELLASPAGQDLRDTPLTLGKAQFRLDAIKEWTGLEPEQIEHALLGVVVRDGGEADLTPPVFLLVHTRKPYDGARVRVALKASRPREERTADGARRTVYSASVRSLPLELWLADERTLVVGILTNLELLPSKPVEGIAHLPRELREVIEKRLATGSPSWVAGHSADWKKTWLPTLTANLKDAPLLTRLEQVRTFALWLVPTKPARIAGAFACADEQAARTLEKAELLPRQQANPDSFRFNRDREWLDIQVTLPQRGTK